MTNVITKEYLEGIELELKDVQVDNAFEYVMLNHLDDSTKELHFHENGTIKEISEFESKQQSLFIYKSKKWQMETATRKEAERIVSYVIENYSNANMTKNDKGKDMENIIVKHPGTLNIIEGKTYKILETYRNYFLITDEEGVARFLHKDRVELTNKVKRPRRKVVGDTCTERFYLTETMKHIADVDLKCAKDWNTYRCENIYLFGPRGGGKTEGAYHMCIRAGFDAVYRMNCGWNTTEQDVKGTLAARSKDGVSVTEFDLSKAIQAFTHNTINPKTGKQEFDENGKLITYGRPAALIFDEVMVMAQEVITAVLNPFLERPEAGESRKITIEDMGHQTLYSHPGFSVIFTANTAGFGAITPEEEAYTSQTNVMDASTNNRMSGKIKFDIDIEVVRKLIDRSVKDDYVRKAIEDLFILNKRTLDQTNGVGYMLTPRNIITLTEKYEQYIKHHKDVRKALSNVIKHCVYYDMTQNEIASYNVSFIDTFFCDFISIDGSSLGSDNWVTRDVSLDT